MKKNRSEGVKVVDLDNTRLLIITGIISMFIGVIATISMLLYPSIIPPSRSYQTLTILIVGIMLIIFGSGAAFNGYRLSKKRKCGK